VLEIREEDAMAATMFVNMQTALRGMLDALVSSWMRHFAAEAEQVRLPNRR
jgi:hypothetical protein